MDCSLLGFSVHRILQQEYESGLPFLTSGNLPNPGIESGSPALQADSLPEPPGKPLLRILVSVLMRNIGLQFSYILVLISEKHWPYNISWEVFCSLLFFERDCVKLMLLSLNVW